MVMVALQQCCVLPNAIALCTGKHNQQQEMILSTPIVHATASRAPDTLGCGKTKKKVAESSHFKLNERRVHLQAQKLVPSRC